jgi:phosphoadenosine phosphosulfate reductase
MTSLLQELQARPLEQKVRDAERLISQALLLGTPAVAWSGGKDSTVLLHMALKQDPGILVVWNNTGVEYPETVRFVKRLQREWKLNLVEARPEVTFWWCVERWGWPLFGKEVRSNQGALGGRFRTLSAKKRKVAGSGARISSYCCDYLKERPMGRVCRERGVEVTLTGMMAGESRQRLFVWFRLGDLYRRKKDGMWRCSPLAGWTDEDIWQYHKAAGIPHCRLYDMGHRRNGCWPCGMDIGFPDNHLARLRVSHPKLWRFLMVDKGLGAELLKIKLALRDGQLDLLGAKRVEDIINERPCFFDTMEGV